ncbi:hypothetical protein [Nodularia spumigena]|uniref:hypothetical protein n=1 Tax=Nodularia spumigena TaxID=70799 RepID=UPI001379C572|nr:hypothetical protein [Nodularia spumigena]
MLSYKKLQQQICRFRMSADILFIQQPPTPDSRLPTPDSRLPTPDSPAIPKKIAP